MTAATSDAAGTIALPETPPRRVRAIALMVATAFFMEQLDATVLFTALPDIARALDADPLRVNLILTAYLVAIAAFLPVSGRMADRFGTRRVFCGAIVAFTFASILCSLATSLEALVAARIVQGVGAAMMAPVGRLLLLRSVPKSELVSAMAWVLTPTMIAPIAGPLVGGFLVTYLSWQWIFYINVPIGIIGITLALVLVKDAPVRDVRPFDRGGALLSGLALAGVVTGAEMLIHGLTRPVIGIIVISGGVAAAIGYFVRARAHPAPVIDLSLLRIPTFAIAAYAGVFFRIGIGAFIFLLPMMLQLGFGMSAFESGVITFASGISALAVKLVTVPLLRRFGYRRVMVLNSVLCAVFLALCAAFRPGWPIAAIYAVVLLGGFVRSLQFNAFGTIAFADVSQPRMGDATSFHSVVQQVSSVLSISIAAAALNLSVAIGGAEEARIGDFSVAFIVVAIITLGSPYWCVRLARDAGAELSGNR